MTFYILFFYSTKGTLTLSTYFLWSEGWQVEYGTIRIKLDELLKASGLSKNMLSIELRCSGRRSTIIVKTKLLV